jgi:hypothetical protein
MELLRRAAGEGCLSYEELADRLDAAGRASTRQELSKLTEDLPVSAGPPAATRDAPPTLRNSVVFRDLVRDGRWTVPQQSRWASVFGNVRLDLRDAVVSAAVIELRVELVFGDLELLVPEGVIVDVRASVPLGDVVQEAGGAGPPGAPRIVVGGWLAFGDVKVRSRRLRERLAARLRRSSA